MGEPRIYPDMQGILDNPDAEQPLAHLLDRPRDPAACVAPLEAVPLMMACSVGGQAANLWALRKNIQ